MKLGYVIVYVPEVAAAISFYERAFSLTRRFVHESGNYGELDTGGTTLAFAHESMQPLPLTHNRAGSPPAAIELALVTEQVHAAYERALSAGAVRVSEPAEKPWGQIVAYVRDRNGVLVELCSPMG